MNPVVFVMFGLMVGVFSGVMGLGGGSVMIPVMVLWFGMTQTAAHGTSLAVMMPMVTLPAVLEYYRNGNVEVKMAIWMAAGVAVGSYFGAYIANSLPKETLKLIFGFTLIYVACYTIFGKENVLRTSVLSAAVTGVAVMVYVAQAWYDRQLTG